MQDKPRPFTLIGYAVCRNTPAPLFVHVHRASSAEEARQQMQAGFPYDAVFQTFEGHLAPVDANGTKPLHLYSAGDLRVIGPGKEDAAPAPRPRP